MKYYLLLPNWIMESRKFLIVRKYVLRVESFDMDEEGMEQMKQVRISKLAKLDLLNIWNYISEDISESSADNFIDRIEE